MAPIDKKLQAALDKLNAKQKKAVLVVAEAFAADNKDVKDHWQDESFVAEMDRRYEEYKSGKVRLFTLNEVQESARKLALKAKSKKAS